jgi:HEAT repeat protein
MRYIVFLALGFFVPTAGQDSAADQNKSKVPDGLKALKHPDPEVRYQAASLLVKLGPVGKIAVPELREALQDTNGFVRVKAAEALWAIEKTSPTVLVPVLTQALKSKDSELRAAAAPVLGKMGAKAKSAVPVLIDALRDKDDGVLVEVVAALAEIGPAAKEAAPALLNMIGAEDRGILESFVVVALGNLGPSVVDNLIKALPDKAVQRRRVAAEALGLLGPNAKPAITALALSLKDSDDQVRLQAAKSLGKIGPDAKEAVSALRGALKDAMIHVRLEAALAVWRIDPTEPHLSIVIGGLGDPSPPARADACRILGTIGPAAKSAAAPLEKILSDKDAQVRQQSAEALGRIGPAAVESSAVLKKLFTDDEPLVRNTSALAYWRVTGQAQEPLKVLEKGLNDDDRLVKKISIQNLGDMGSAAQSLIPILIDFLQEDDANLREAAKAALKKIDPTAAKKAGVR